MMELAGGGSAVNAASLSSFIQTLWYITWKCPIPRDFISMDVLGPSVSTQSGINKLQDCGFKNESECRQPNVNRPGEAGAVLQASLSLIHSLN